jgi:2-hydroxy-6-oxonona-2,4-dienedioate hydrolase
VKLDGPARRAPGEGFALRRGIWAWASTVAAERRKRPAGMALRGGPALTSRRYETTSGTIHARVSDGTATQTAIVLVHGVIVSSRYLMPLGVELAGESSVLIPDLPGYGVSARPREAPTLAALADAVIACAQAAGHERVALVGNSFGAQVVVEAAVRHPERVESIVLLGPTVDPAARSLVAQAIRWLRNAPDEHLSVLPIMIRDLLDVGPPRAARLLRVMLADRIEHKLGDVTCRALVVRGGRDRVVPAEWADRAARLLPRAQLAVVEGYAHMAHYSGALALAPVIRDFVRAHASAPGMTLPRRVGS